MVAGNDRYLIKEEEKCYIYFIKVVSFQLSSCNLKTKLLVKKVKRTQESKYVEAIKVKKII